MGYTIQWDANGKTTLEADTIDCKHCQKVLLKHFWSEKGGWCFGCGWAVCHPCFVKMQSEGCLPFKKQIDLAVDELHKRRLW